MSDNGDKVVLQYARAVETRPVGRIRKALAYFCTLSLFGIDLIMVVNFSELWWNKIAQIHPVESMSPFIWFFLAALVSIGLSILGISLSQSRLRSLFLANLLVSILLIPIQPYYRFW